jgi:YidC/Oxa1 family membrane protein insertase
VIVGGILTPLEDLFTWALVNLHDVVGSWSWAIVALTIVVRMLLVPLTVRQIHSMQNLQLHAPEMKAIQQKYKSDRKRQNEELMKFYRENNINPAASCLPLIAQIPVFIGLFFVLRDFETEVLPKYPEKGGVEWLGLVNITEDTLVGWGPLLLVVYVISQLTSTYLMSQQMQKAQRILMLALPIVFIPFILNFPSGLMIYWLTTNLWTTGQGLVTRRFIPKPATPEKRSSRTPAKAATSAAVVEGDGGEEEPAAAPRPAGSGQPRQVRRKKKRGGARR